MRSERRSARSTPTPVASIRTVESYLNAGQTALLQYGETLLGIVALVALVAGAVGVYALTAYGVAHRQSVLALGLFVVAAVVIGAAAGWAAGCGSPASSSRFSRISRSRRQIPCRSSSPAAYPGDCARHFLVGFLVGRGVRRRRTAETQQVQSFTRYFYVPGGLHAS